MNDLLLLGILFLAVALGWWLGRHGEKRLRLAWDPSSALPSQYYRGLNFLLDGSQDSAIDAFTQALEVNSETFDTHIALGNVLRKRGEVERAIRIHQNLLARPSLPVGQLHLAHLELARDYISAGLFDRAERLLLDLVSESGRHRRVARRHLLEIYEAQRDWQAARDVADALQTKRSLLRGSSPVADEVGQPVPVLLAHYCCEQANDALERNDFAAARSHLNQALKYDRGSVRATLQLGELELKSGNPAKAAKILKNINDQDSDFVPASVELLRQSLVAIGRREELQRYLEACFQANPSTPLVLAIAEEIRDTQGAEEAQAFLRESLSAKPSLRGLAMLMRLHNAAEAGDDEYLQIDIIKRLVEARSTYRCFHCGFKGQQLHWYCPGCKHWGTVRDQGTTGEFVRA